ncbi:MAG: helix-turn-helix domain-containing protein [Planctomycetaceae bacterium]|nr:helix-turn-helix domain-containing protein [Planctomycetaceae bacterium]
MELLRISETAEKCRVSERTIQRLVAADRFPQPVRIGARVVWPREVIDDFLRGNDRPGVEDIQL